MTSSAIPWDGNPLSDGPVALMLSGGDDLLQEHGDWLVATVGGRTQLVRYDQIRQFLAIHSTRFFVCRDAGSIYWTLDAQLRANSACDAISQLRRAVQEGRFVDLDIWQRLVDLAEDGYGERTTPLDADGAGDVSRLTAQAMELEDSTKRLLGIPPGSLFSSVADRFGLNHVVKALVAVARTPSVRFPLAPAERADAVAELLGRLEQLTIQVKRYKDLSRCYEWEGGSLKLHNELPQYERRRLPVWLQERWNRLREPHDYPLRAPQRNGKISIRPHDWGRLVNCDEQLALWAELEKYCQAVKSLQNITGDSYSIDYELVPRFRTTRVGIDLIAAGDRLRPMPDATLLLVRFPDLESRCLAAVCRERYGASKLAELANEPGNLNQHIAAALVAINSSGPGGRSNPNAITPAVVEGLLFATGLSLGDRAADGLLKRADGVPLDLAMIRDARERLVRAFPELNALECETAAVFHRRFAYGPPISEGRRQIAHEIHEALDPSAHVDDRRCQLQRIMARHQISYDKSQELLGKLRSDCSQESLTQDLLAETRRTRTGRLRGNCRLTEATAEFLDLADDVYKTILYVIAIEQNLPVGIVSGTLILELPDGDPGRFQSQVEAIAQVAGQQLLCLPLQCEFQVVVR